jgi:hypothetical protein
VIEAHAAKKFLIRDVFLLAIRANDPDQSLGHDPCHRGGDHVRGQSDVHEPCDG